MTVKRVIFIRPGETDWNTEGRYQGWVASPLNAHGRAQVASLAKYIRHIGMAALYTSDLRRALETANLLAAQLGYTPIADERLRERHVGQWQGLTLQQIHQWYPEQYTALLDDLEHYNMPGGESRADVRARVRAAFADVLAQDRGETIGIVTHTNATNMLLDDLVPGYEVYKVGLTNSSVTTVARGSEADPWALVTANDVSHLEGLASQFVTEVEEDNR